MQHRFYLNVVILGLLTAHGYGGTPDRIYYVDADSQASNPNGLSWATAFPSLQQALSATDTDSNTVEHIYVANGGMRSLLIQPGEHTLVLVLPLHRSAMLAMPFTETQELAWSVRGFVVSEMVIGFIAGHMITPTAANCKKAVTKWVVAAWNGKGFKKEKLVGATLDQLDGRGSRCERRAASVRIRRTPAWPRQPR